MTSSDSPGAVRRDAGTGRVAVRTAPSVTVGDWFVFDPAAGGYYSNGVREGVAGWPAMTPGLSEGEGF